MTEKKNRKDRIENVTYPILPCKLWDSVFMGRISRPDTVIASTYFLLRTMRGGQTVKSLKFAITTKEQ